ncbi:MAG: LysE family transporter, partial [Chloroflexota bacterium]|nr:LysE family transporter [Chloroflexota bacterium]
ARQGWNKIPMPTASSAGQIQSKAMVLSGIIGSMSNPYWFIWWATIGMTYLLWALKIGTAGVASFFTGHILADLTWYTLISFIVVSGKRIMNDLTYHWLLMVCGTMLVGLGSYFIISGVRFLTG